MKQDDRRGDEPGRRRIPQQVTRLAALFLLFGLALVVARHYLVPPTFGQIGHYRAAAVAEIAARPIKYAGREACADCHQDVIETHDRGRHQFVACEACHGPAAAHAGAPTDVKPNVPRQRDFCPRCHEYDPSRPTGFPQIEQTTHNAGQPCITCHNPHAPAPPTLPSSCAACHGEIARAKANSFHATVPCTRCHEASDQHKDMPRANPPTKPTTREFCGSCHAKDAKSAPEIARVDLSSHGQRFLCWQCHYPHTPEVR